MIISINYFAAALCAVNAIGAAMESRVGMALFFGLLSIGNVGVALHLQYKEN